MRLETERLALTPVRSEDKAIAALALPCLAPVFLGVLGTIVPRLFLPGGLWPMDARWHGLLAWVASVGPSVVTLSPLLTVPGLVLASIVVRRVGRQHALGQALVRAAGTSIVLNLFVALVFVSGIGAEQATQHVISLLRFLR